MLERLYDTTSGRILIDDTPVDDIDIDKYRECVALVSQEARLFNMSIEDNVSYGMKHRPSQVHLFEYLANRSLKTFLQAEMMNALSLASADQFVDELPKGSETIVGDGGGKLSGGQRQRISIARALLIDPRILIMDEATSSVDTTTEKEIQKALDDLRVGRTTVVVAHRLQTIINADRICVIDGGRLAETGVHSELIARAGVYRDFFSAQFGDAGASLTPEEPTR